MIRKDIVDYIHDNQDLQRGVPDDFLTPDIIHSAINDAMDRLTIDLNLNEQISHFGRRENEWQYALPDGILKIRNLFFFDDDSEWQEVDYLDADRFLAQFDETDTDDEPDYFSTFGRMAELHWFSTESGTPTNKFANAFYAAVEGTGTLTVYGSNFGLLMSGQRMRRGDTLWNVDDDSYGFIDYLDWTTAAQKATGTLTSATATRIYHSGQFSSVVAGDVIRRTTTNNDGDADNSWAYIVKVDSGGDWVDYADMQGATDRFVDDDTYVLGSPNKIVLQQFGSSAGGLRGGTDNTFEVADSGVAGTAVNVSTTDNTSDTIAPQAGSWDTDSITTDMIALDSTNERSGKIRAVSAATIQVDYWHGGLPSTGDSFTFQTADKFSVESQFATKDTLWLSPISSETDIGTERMRLLWNAAPTKPTADRDPIEIPDRHKQELYACVLWQIGQRTNVGLRAVQGLLTNYRQALATSVKLAEHPSGQIATVAHARLGRQVGSKRAAYGRGRMRARWTNTVG